MQVPLLVDDFLRRAALLIERARPLADGNVAIDGLAEQIRQAEEKIARGEHKQHKFLWVPFGGGGHKCIGLHFADMLFKCLLFNVLKHHRVEYVDQRQASGKILSTKLEVNPQVAERRR